MKKILPYVLIGIVLGTTPLEIKIVDASEFGEGKRVYETRCQICHGPKGDGNGPGAAAFYPKPVDFTDPKFWQGKDIDKTITDTVDHGHGMMPPIGLKPEEIKAVIDYISHAFKPSP